MKVVVLGVDGSPCSAAATSWTADLASSTGASVVAVHAVALLEHEKGDPLATHLLGRMHEWTADLDRLPAELVRRRVVNGEPVLTLLMVAAEEQADLVVVGSRGAGAHRHGVLGSTSLQLAEQCPWPLTIVPLPEDGGGDPDQRPV